MKKLLSIILFICIALFANAYDFVIDGIAYKLNSNGISVMVTNGINYIGDIEIPSSVTYNGNTYSVTSIGNGAFSGCSGLTSITIGNSVTSIGNGAFSGCSGLTSVTIGNSVTEISAYCFDSCTGLTSVTIPNSVTTIGNGAFYSCSGLTLVTWNAKIGNDFTSSGYSPFNDCTNIQFFSFGNEVEKIPAFLCYGLIGLTSVTIPNSVILIGNGAFEGCSGLNTAIIGENVTSIGEKAFKNCSLLDNLVALRERPIFISSNVFEGVPKASCDLHVRQGSKIRYENQDVWKDFLIIFEDAEDWADVSGGGSSGVYGDVNGDGVVTAADVTAVYDVLLGNQ